MGKRTDNTYLAVAQFLVCAAVFLLPAGVNYFISGNLDHARGVMISTFHMLWPCLVIYLVNYFFLVPCCLFKDKRRIWFWVGNLILLIVLNRHFIHPGHGPNPAMEWDDHFPINRSEMWAFYVGGILSWALFQSVFILLAVGIRNIGRSHKMELQLQEEKRKTSEAELTWLKHQLNPHFLFNTLNNISSLTQIDPDKAQESIGQLSDLLRYALYDSEAEKVPLAAEMEFMSNYVDLMALRCNELTKVEKEFEVPQEHVEVAPLLFISLVENAFKHGVNARYPSSVKVIMYYRNGEVVFHCFNTVFYNNKPIEIIKKSDKVGSGIGLENMKRRLELLYPGRYTYEQKIENDTYIVTVEIDV
jgi:hypothetical protein